MNILNKLGIKMENLFGLLEVDMDSDKIVLHMTKPEEELNAFDFTVRSLLAANIQQAIYTTVEALSTMADMAEATEDALTASEIFDAISGSVEMSEEEIEAELERSKREIQQMYDVQMAKILRQKGQLN
jgi:Trp operon repressor